MHSVGQTSVSLCYLCRNGYTSTSQKHPESMRAKNIWKKDVDSSVGSCGGRRHVLSVLDVQLLQASVTASSLPRSYKVCGVCVCVSGLGIGLK